MVGGVMIVVMACGGASGTPTGSTSADSTSSGPSMTSADATTEPTGSSSASGSQTGDTSDASTDAGTSGGPAGGVQLFVAASARAVLEADEGGELTVACHVFRDGAPVTPDSVGITVTPLRGVTQRGGVYSFESFGIFDASCEVEVDGEVLASTTRVAVLNEILDPSLARASAGLGAAMGGLFDVIASNGQDDQVLIDAVATLGTALPHLAAEQYTDLDDVLRHVPGDYYPTPADLDAMGIVSTADDAALEGAIDDLDAALAGLQSTVAAFDPAAPTDADAAALADHAAQVEASVAALLALEVTEHGLMSTRTRVAALVRDRIAPTTQTVVGWADARIRSEADVLFTVTDPAAEPLHFGLLGLTLGMFGDSYLQIRLVNDWYGEYLAQLDESFNNFILAGAIDYFIPIGDNPPTIDLLVASASVGFATPGYPSWVDGFNFHEDPEMNLFLVFGDSWQGIIDAIISACGIEEADTIPEKVETLVECFEEIEGAAESIFLVPLSVGPGLYGSEQGLDLGEFPEVCSGGLPTATFLLPINYETGRGPTYFINCI